MVAVRPGSRIASLMYHEVTDEPWRSGFQRRGARPYTLTPAAFQRHLDVIADSPCPPSLVTGCPQPDTGHRLLLTFDDGGRSATATAEMLEHRGWRGHFFIVTGLLGSDTFLDAAAVRALADAGHVVGSHSHNHPDIFRALSELDMHEEWRVSCDVLAQILGRPCLAASVPGGDISPAALDSADAAGFRYLFTSEPWLVPRCVGQCLILGRFAVRATTSLSSLRSLTHFRGWTRALMERRLKTAARRGLGPLYRLYVRGRTRPIHPGESS